ncbi:MAG: SixA phosphatase family protein [Thermoplasmata archaeon]
MGRARAPAPAARVVVFRHGPAESRDPARWPDDAERALSAEGLRETRRAARGLARALGRVSTLATSPARRARSTAEVLGAALDPSRRPTFWPELASGAPAAPLLPRLVRAAGPGRTVVLVGHAPMLSELVGLALTGDEVPIVRLTKAGAACLEFPRGVRAGAAELRWLLTRKQLAETVG